LRFPEFEGEWETKKLGEIGDFKNGINKSSEDFGFGVPFVNLMDIFGKSNISSKEEFSLVNANDREVNLYDLRKGDVLFIRSSVKRSGVGETSVILEDLYKTVYSGFLIRFRDNKIQLNINFKKYCFSTSSFRNRLISLSSTSANTNINQDSLSSLDIYFPTKNEQKKISCLLSLIDDKIQTQNKILLHYQSLIKNLRNGIFKQKIRFKNAEGDNFSDWNIVELGSIAKKINTKNKEMAIKTVLSNSATFGIMNQSDFFDKEIANPNNINGYYIVEKDDFVYNPRISKEAPVGPISRNKVGVGVISPLYMVFRFREGDIDYLEHFFNSDTWFGHMENIANYGARADRMSFSSSDFSKMLIPVPEIREQIRIASFLSNIDQKIQIEKAILKQLEHQKQSLLKQMFV